MCFQLIILNYWNKLLDFLSGVRRAEAGKESCRRMAGAAANRNWRETGQILWFAGREVELP